MTRTGQKSNILKKPKNISIQEWRDAWGIPNWELPSQYPKGLRNDGLKWEFLRRDKNYRYIYAQYQETREEHKEMRQKEFEEEIWDSASSALEFGLADLIDPKIPATELNQKIFRRQYRGTQVTKYSEGMLWTGKWGRPAEDIISNNYKLVIFDLRYPLSHQINLIADQLKSAQKKISKKEGIEVISREGITKNYLQHLRTLDAYSEQASSLAVGKMVFGIKDDKEARDRANYEFKRAQMMWRYF